MVEHDDAIGSRRFFHEMRDVDDGLMLLFVKLLDDGQDFRTSLRVKHGRRFVEHETFRLHRERSGNRDALLLPA